jgi:mannitol 2-dehydrogenase
VHAYETMKIRILNAGHQVLANAGEILSVDTIADCMAHPVISAFFHKVQHQDIAPTVLPTPDMQPADYVDLIARRFANARIIDTTRRVAFDGSSRHPGFVLPIIRDRLAAGASARGLALVEALWARMCEGTREDASHIAPNDPFWNSLQSNARLARQDPAVWLLQANIYGKEFQDTAFAASFEDWLGRIWADGVTTTLAHYLDEH